VLNLWVSADPAEVLDDLLEPELRSACEAADAARTDVAFSGAFRCESADPAADLDTLLESLLLRTFEAADAARLLVTSDLLAIVGSLGMRLLQVFDNLYRRRVIKNKYCH